jgi:hypothetical protein
MNPDEVFADAKSEGAPLEINATFDRLDAKGDKSSESQTGMKTDKPSQGGGNTPEAKTEPFHKHPRWIQTQKELKETREKIAKLESERTQNQPAALPDWWKKQYGDTPESKQRYEAVVQKDGELDWIKSQVLESIKSEQQAQSSQKKTGEEYVNTQIQEMTDEGLKFERNALLKFMVDFQKEYGAGGLLDDEGNYDFRKSLTLMNRMQPQESKEDSTVRKQLASVGRGKANSARSSNIPVVSRNALRRGNWRDAETGQFKSN